MRLFGRKQTDRATPRRRLSDIDARLDSQDSKQQIPQYTYRRNQTLTGSNTVGSAGEQSAQRQSPRIVAHTLQRTRRKMGSLLVASIVAATVMIGLLYQFTATVHVSIYGQVKQVSTTHTYELYRDTIESYLKEYPLQRFRGLLNTEQLQHYFESKLMYEVQSIKPPSYDSMGTTQYELKMREPIASWKLTNGLKYVDSSGVIFDKNFYGEPKVTIIDESNLQSGDVRTATSGRFLSFIGQAVGGFSQLKHPVSQIILPVSTTRQVIGVLDGYKVKLSVDRAAGEQVEDAVRAVTHLKKQNIQTEYVDVRVSRRAYYR